MTRVAIGSARLKPVRQDHHTRKDREHRAEQVGEHLVGRSAQVQRARVRPVQHQHRDAIGEETDGGEGDHRPGIDGPRVAEPADAGVDQVAADAEQHQRVDEGGQDLGAVQAERRAWARRPGGDVRRPQREHDRRAASVPMWPASASKARESVTSQPTTSSNITLAVTASTIRNRDRSAARRWACEGASPIPASVGTRVSRAATRRRSPACRAPAPG